MPDWLIEPIAKKHDRKNFSSGTPELDKYLREQARKNAESHKSSTRVAVEQDSLVVRGYYTLAMTSILREDFSADPRGFPDPIPAALIARLAIDNEYQRKGLGTILLVDALRRIAAASSEIAAYAVVLDAMTDEAATWYQRFEFAPLRDSGRHLFLPLSAVRELLAREDAEASRPA